MAMEEGIENKKGLPLKKHVGAVHSASGITLLQRKIANALLYNAYGFLKTKETHEIKISQLSELIGYNSRDSKQLKTALIKLMSTVIEWNLIDKERNIGIWSASSIIADAQIDGSICRYSYSPTMRDLLHNPQMYAVIDLKVQERFKSAYALALYENCIRFVKIPGEPQTPWIPMQDFRRLMGIEDGKYKDFKDFKKRVIKIAVEEVNAYSPINLNVEYRQSAGKVEEIKFFIEKKEESTEALPSVVLESPAADLNPSMDSLADDLKATFGLTQKAADKLIEVYGDSSVIAKVEMIMGSASYKAGKIKNLAGYLTRALEDGYSQAPVMAADSVAPTVSADAIFEIRKKYDRYVEKAVYAFYMNLEEKEQRSLLKQFKESLVEGRGGLYVDCFEKEGLQNSLVLTQFVGFLRSQKHTLIKQVNSFQEFSSQQLAMS